MYVAGFIIAPIECDTELGRNCCDFRDFARPRLAKLRQHKRGHQVHVRDDRGALRTQGNGDGRPHRFPGFRPADGRTSTFRSGDHRGPAEHGEDLCRPVHRPEPGRAARDQDACRNFQPGDVEGAVIDSSSLLDGQD